MRKFRTCFNHLRKVGFIGQKPCYNFLVKDDFPFLSENWPVKAKILQNSLTLEGIFDLKTISEFVDKVNERETHKIQTDPRKEFLVVGRSNVGKSSLINSLTLQGAAMTSNYPGKTRNLFFYKIGTSELVLVDAPGYGFAKGDKNELVNWGKMIVRYLDKSTTLYRVVCLVDSEHGMKDTDFMLFDLLEKKNKPFMLCLTKCDKLSGQSLDKLFEETAEKMKKYNFCSPIINATSSKNGYGIQELRSHIVYLLNVKSL